MFYRASLYVALAIFALGLAYKVFTWFTYRIGADAAGFLPRREWVQRSKAWSGPCSAGRLSPF